jgi:hypothetical protein
MNKGLYSHQGSLLHFVFELLPYIFVRVVGPQSVGERERHMNLPGSIKDLQNTIVQLYLKLEQRFSENQLIRELWGAMAHDISQQIRSLNALPQSFWNQLKKDQDGISIEAAESIREQNIDIKEDQSLGLCFDHALRLEEPTILKVYVPVIRLLRENLTAPSLDFYIVVKAHLARITRMIESYSGDPVVIQRSNSLLQTFEKEVQEPRIEVRGSEAHKAPAGQTTQRKEPMKKSRKAVGKAHPLAKRTKILHSRTKPLVKKVGLQRRRARR